ncbi:MAG: matrixin family metalloprotease [Pirellulales bacterium]
MIYAPLSGQRKVHQAMTIAQAICLTVAWCVLSTSTARAANTVTWSLIPTGASSGDSASITALGDFMPAGFKSEILAAMDMWSSVADVQFVEVPDSGPGGATLRIGGHSFGSLGVPGHAYLPTAPGPEAGDIHFATEYNWVLDTSGLMLGGSSVDTYSVALHEIGHALFGFEHTEGAMAVMNPVLSSLYAYSGLLPTDIADAQAVFGVAPGYVAPPATNVTLTVLPSSKLDFSATIMGNTLFASTPVAGSIDSFISEAGGTANALRINGANLLLNDMSAILGLIKVQVTGAQGALFGTDAKPVAGDGSFDSGDLLLGLVDGTVATTGLINSTIDLFDTPLAMGTNAGIAAGTVKLSPSMTPSILNVDLAMPVKNTITVDGAFLVAGLTPGTVNVTLSLDGQIDAVGTMIVPEPSTLTFIASLVLFLPWWVFCRRATLQIKPRTMEDFANSVTRTGDVMKV